MHSKHAEPSARSFDAMSAIGLSEEARKAVNEAFDAMSSWRIETAKSSEKNSEQVIEKMAAAARVLGWPGEIVDAIRTQMQSITKLQIETMDRIMDAWEEQIKVPNPMTISPAAMLSKLRSLPGLSPAGTWPGSDADQMGAMNPLQFWMKFAEQWQKASAEALASWTKGSGRGHAGGGAPPLRIDRFRPDHHLKQKPPGPSLGVTSKPAQIASSIILRTAGDHPAPLAPDRAGSLPS
jgi:hypothetical protein